MKPGRAGASESCPHARCAPAKDRAVGIARPLLPASPELALRFAVNYLTERKQRPSAQAVPPGPALRKLRARSQSPFSPPTSPPVIDSTATFLRQWALLRKYRCLRASFGLSAPAGVETSCIP